MDLAKKIKIRFRTWVAWCRQWPLVLVAFAITVFFQLIVLTWQVVGSEWVLHRGITVRLKVDPAGSYDFFRGPYFEFIPSVFRHSFPSSRSILAGDQVVVGPTDRQNTQWAILSTAPTGNVPYYRVMVKSSNAGYFFLTPPFLRIYLDTDAMAAVRKGLNKGRNGQKEPIYLIVKHYKEHAMISGLQVGTRNFYQK